METQKSKKSDYVAYEYLTVRVKKEMEPFYTDCYENLGWECIYTPENEVSEFRSGNVIMMDVKFKRDRKIKNRSMLFSLQKKCETALRKIDQLERSKEIPSLIVALIIGIAGLGFLAIAVFSFLNGNVFIGVLSASIGCIGCVLPYYFYKKIRIEREVKLAPLVEEQYDMVYKTCEQARNLLA